MRTFKDYKRKLGYIVCLLGLSSVCGFAQTNNLRRGTSKAVAIPRVNADSWQLRMKGVTSNGLTYIVYHDFKYYPTQEMVRAAEETSLAAVKILKRYKQKRPISEYGAILSLPHEWDVDASFYSKRRYKNWENKSLFGIMGGAPDYFNLKFTIGLPETLTHNFEYY